MLLGLGVLWAVSEIINHKYKDTYTPKITDTLQRIDTPSILFFLGILLAVAGLQNAGILKMLSEALASAFGDNFYLINLIIGVLSSIIDNVPLVAGTMGMYEIAEVGAFAMDGSFWTMLAYCAGTGGSILIIGSAAGVAVMGMEVPHVHVHLIPMNSEKDMVISNPKLKLEASEMAEIAANIASKF